MHSVGVLPSHDGSCRLAFGPSLVAIVFIPISLVDDLLGYDFFDDVCLDWIGELVPQEILTFLLLSPLPSSVITPSAP
jgi:hypothetical protein